MSSAAVLLVIQGIQAAIAAAPSAVALVKSAKDFIAQLFAAGLISKATQDAMHAHVDAVCAAALRGELGPEFKVEADPS